ncbi:MAG: metallophosphoesterase [Thermoleophilaceae bacterium]
MRALAHSDMHLGAWTGDPVLAREPALAAVDAALEDVDELILLGDVFDFLCSSVEYAFEQADPFFELVQRRMQGRRVVFTAGNHDHHIVYPETQLRKAASSSSRADSGSRSDGRSPKAEIV